MVKEVRDVRQLWDEEGLYTPTDIARILGLSYERAFAIARFGGELSIEECAERSSKVTQGMSTAEIIAIMKNENSAD